MAAIFVFGEKDGGRVAYEMDGTLNVMQESLGFGRYSATDRSLRFPRGTKLPKGRVQIDDPTGGLAWWEVVEDGTQVWVTKETGMPDVINGVMIQLVRSFDGRLVLRRPQ